MDDESGMIKIGTMVCSRDDDAWDEKGRTNIVQIFISYGDDGINSIQFQYAENGALVLSQKHGANVGYKFDVVRLSHPNEYITWISGQVESNFSYLRSLTFGTNQGEYGPFGPLSARNRESFCFKLGQEQDCQFGGFYGTVDKSAGTLNSIGVYLNPITNLELIM